jgi:hypothetical protein
LYSCRRRRLRRVVLVFEFFFVEKKKKAEGSFFSGFPHSFYSSFNGLILFPLRAQNSQQQFPFVRLPSEGSSRRRTVSDDSSSDSEFCFCRL